ncbi:MAG: acetaldehyde dehydrogenase (acetylating) [Planctomycetes bacterium]|nr:acetaldehyde dehydrogenase (acetylating) [Planctomycetota bacterium]MBL7038236.1 acetaldehyde dehydrogenase (acetylating) [Pirellulaceae bacterium]
MDSKIKVAVIGPGNIGTDLMYKIRRSQYMDLALMTGIKPDSEGLALAGKLGIPTSLTGIDAILENDEVQIVFESTGAKPHLMHAPMLKEAGKIAIDLTPAAVGPYVVPYVNLHEHLDEPNVNMVTCGGQATTPIVAAISRACHIRYAEIVATIASKSAGPGTRQNIDEFTRTTAQGLEVIGGADKGKAIIVLNPAEPPIMMRDTIFALVDDPDEAAIRASVQEMVRNVQKYVPGYRLKVEPFVDGDKVTTMIEVEGAGDYLPKYSGNLDIMTAAACAVGEVFAEKLLN